MLARIPRLILAGSLTVFVLAGLLGVGYLVWDPEPPRDPNTVVMRVRFVGGMGGPSFLARPIADVSVYGDGRIIVQKTVYDGTGGASSYLNVLKDSRLTRDAFHGLYRDALIAGLGKSHGYRGDQHIMDGGLTEVALVDGGGRHVTTVGMGAKGPRPWLINWLAHRLRNMPHEDLARPAVTYRPERMAVIAWRPDKTSYGTEDQEERPWPFRPLTEGNPRSCMILTGAEAQEVEQLSAKSNQRQSAWRSGVYVYNIQFRPMLPDEKDCDAISQRRA